MFLDNKNAITNLFEEQLDLNNNVCVNELELKSYVSNGFSSDKLRHKYWMLFLNYFPLEKKSAMLYYKKHVEFYDQIEIKENEILEKDLLRTDCLIEGGRFCGYKNAIKIILLKYESVNQSIGYVQGMISIAVVFYNVIYSADDDTIKANAEVHAFYLFHNLIAELKECFTEKMDEDTVGISGRISRVFEILREKDILLHEEMEIKGLCKTTFPLKWILQLFTTVFDDIKILLLWDRLFADTERFDLLEYIAAVLIFFKREEIMNYDFNKCMFTLQNLGEIDLEKIFFIVDRVKNNDLNFQEVFQEYLAYKSYLVNK
ncbi:Tbc1d13 [Ecytonucleospora hepatopenaei]|uniref:Tbc1d13 n=1 Tax=Ecytonucleospora hepatopenaei TaxID=646526 RepID=A0A1W0E5R8_9MICR|nr:Tbc1d13 [Ecytonucleospora hepatopenaei]